MAVQVSSGESEKVYEMASNSSRREHFVNSVVDFCQNYDFDGIDLVWQFGKIPTPTDGSSNLFNKTVVTTLLKDLNESFRFVDKMYTKKDGSCSRTCNPSYLEAKV